MKTRVEEEGGYSAAAGRKFAITLTIAFAVLAAILYWQGRERAAAMLGAIAAALGVAALAIPSRLGPLERTWMRFAYALSRVTTPIFMGIVYFVVLTPVGLVRRAFGRNSLVRPRGLASFWISRPTAPDATARRRRMERQF